MGLYIGAAMLAGILMGIGFRRAERAFFLFRGLRALRCPENRQPAAVELASWHIILTAFLGNPVPRVRNCSRWPERRNCDQGCIREVQAEPARGLVRSIVANWCRYNSCGCCGAPIGKLHVGPHQPHVLNRELRILEWKEIAPQDLPQALRSCEPVCETCVEAETQTW
jgi:hypothetical protein